MNRVQIEMKDWREERPKVKFWSEVYKNISLGGSML